MRLAKDDEPYDRPDWGTCPHCEAEILDLANDVTDMDFRDDECRDVAGIDCPACGKRIALVREHDYRLVKIAEAP